MTNETIIQTFQVICIECGAEYAVTNLDAAINGWTSWADVRHIGCMVAPRFARDPYDVSQWTDREVREMREQAEGLENVSR